MVGKGIVKINVNHTYPLKDAAQAHTRSRGAARPPARSCCCPDVAARRGDDPLATRFALRE